MRPSPNGITVSLFVKRIGKSLSSYGSQCGLRRVPHRFIRRFTNGLHKELKRTNVGDAKAVGDAYLKHLQMFQKTLHGYVSGSVNRRGKFVHKHKRTRLRIHRIRRPYRRPKLKVEQ